MADSTDDDRGYRLLDCGDGRKLERCGERTLVRPAPGARERPGLSTSRWDEADIVYEVSGRGGRWRVRNPPPEPWLLRSGGRTFLLKLAPSGQIGFFPEQEPLRERLGGVLGAAASAATPPPEVLNLFAYTGGSTLAAVAAGARVTHVDAARSTLGWARANLERNGLGTAPVRWLPEDATRFVERAVRRGSRFAAILLDPPSFGRGPRGRTWSLAKDLGGLLAGCRRLLAEEPLLLLVTAHTQGWEATALAARLDRACAGLPGATDSGDLELRAEAGPVLRAGVFALRVFHE